MLQFVALDLETTGLNPSEDTIIEIAAIRFRVEQQGDDEWYVIDTEEKSMLINPLRELKEEVTLITGISDEMLREKPTWDTVKEKVRDFIGDAIIVGHNVLFDIAVLSYHEIDLRHHTILDTFELSEIFSQDEKSLNLGFLAGSYGISAGDKEHRALGDTRLSVGLFLHYLNAFEKLSPKEFPLFSLVAKKEEKKNIGILFDITRHREMQGEEIFGDFQKYEKYDGGNFGHIKKQKRTLHFLESPSEEKELFEQYKQRGFDIILPSRKGAHFFTRRLQEYKIQAQTYHEPGEYLSLDALRESQEETSWSRKYSILVLKILFWLQKTPTGRLDELKYYGNEYKEIEFLRAESGEETSRKERPIENASSVFSFGSYIKNVHTTAKHETLIIRDIGLFEESMRKFLSKKVVFGELYTIFEADNTMIETIGLMEGFFLGLPKRPNGPNEMPPGEYGETYILDEQEVWHQGGKWLSLIRLKLEYAFRNWENTLPEHARRKEKKIQEMGRDAIQTIIDFASLKRDYTMILSVQNGESSITLVPKTVQQAIEKFFRHLPYTHIIAYTTGKPGLYIQNFLQETYKQDIWTSGENKSQNNTHSLIIENPYEHAISGCTLILTTSQKDAREIGKSLQRSGHTIYTQGISGGKGKIQSLFLKNAEKSIIVGTIENWHEEYELLQHIREIIIVKMPFDPPSDTYFVARTKGLKNNFDLYSIPMVIQKLNSLIFTMKSINPTCAIFCWDTRLENTEWGKRIYKEIL